MNRSRSSFDGLPLFAGEPDIWKSLDEPIKEQVLNALAMLLLRHIGRAGADTLSCTTLQKEPTDGR